MKKLVVNETNKINQISEDIYGHFAEHLGRCIYEGIFVGKDSDIPNVNGMRSDVVGALQELEIPVLRWPGGCFAEDYHWKEGVGPLEQRKPVINSLWGGVLETNHFGTHEFFELCRQLDCKTYVNLNMGSASVREMQEWVEYMTGCVDSDLVLQRKANGQEEPFVLDYVGIGNEMWGCGGNMNPEHYASEFRRYNNFARSYDWNAPFKRIASGPNRSDYAWTEGVMKGLTETAHGRDEITPYYEMTGMTCSGLALHYYCFPKMETPRGSSTDFVAEEWYNTLSIAADVEELVIKHSEIMRKYDPEGHIKLMIDEWGSWYSADEGTNPFWLYQQNTMRDAQVAALSLNIFNKHADKIDMANIAQTVNVLQAMILTEGDKMIKTPTYHVFNMYKGHKNAKLVESRIEGAVKVGAEGGLVVNDIFESVSVGRKGVVNITLNNTSMTEDHEVEIAFEELNPSKVTGEILAGEFNAHNTFDNPEAVETEDFEAFEITEKGIKLTIPACAVIALKVKG